MIDKYTITFPINLLFFLIPPFVHLASNSLIPNLICFYFLNIFMMDKVSSPRKTNYLRPIMNQWTDTTSVICCLKGGITKGNGEELLTVYCFTYIDLSSRILNWLEKLITRASGECPPFIMIGSMGINYLGSHLLACRKKKSTKTIHPT